MGKAEYRVERVASELKAKKRNNKQVTILTGAGCSKAAGIPLAGEFMRIIREEHNEAYQYALWEDLEVETNYMKCMAALDADDRRRLIKSYVDDATINFAHIAIACLMKEGYVDRVLTFNFDNVLIRACALVGISPPVFDMTVHKDAIEYDNLEKPSIFYLHGQSSGFRLLNTEAKIVEHIEHIKPLFNMSYGGSAWLVAGYSGESDPVFEKLMATCKHFPNKIYWTYFRGPEGHSLNPGVRHRLVDVNEDVVAVPTDGADIFFCDLARELGCFPPDFVLRPFTSLRESMKRLSLYPSANPATKDSASTLREDDFVGPMRRKIDEAIRTIEAKVDEATVLAWMMAENYDEVVKVYEKNRANAEDWLKTWTAIAYLRLGNQQYELSARDQSIRYLNIAVENYKNALDIQPNMHEGFYNLGNAFEAIAARTRDPALYDAAIENYARAVYIKPDKHDAYNNWGNALVSKAEITTNAALYSDAFEKYDQAIKIKPDKHKAYNNWGNALVSKAELTRNAALFNAAYEKYDTATEITPDDHEAYNNWGVALQKQAIMTKNSALCRAAFRKYSHALEVKSDFPEAYYNWGLALTDFAGLTHNPAHNAQAAVMFARAVNLKPDMHEAHYNWGLVLLDLAVLPIDVKLLDEAIAKFKQSIQIYPDKYGAYNNWGVALQRKAILANDLSFLDEAIDKYKRAEEIKTGAGAYGLACVSAIRGEEEKAREWLEKCIEHNTLPPRDHLANDEDFKAYRDRDWFKEMLEKAPS